MPTYTENYNLTKPVRGAEIVDINVINGNMDTIDAIMHSTQISLAEPYDDTRTSENPYNTGDLCLQDFHVYRCDEDGVYGAWDATKWTQTTLAENTGGGTASEVSYDNTDSGMTATNVQDAVDELKEAIDDIPQTEVEVEASEEGQSIATIEVNGDSTSINLPAIEGSGSGAVVTIEDALNKAISKLSFKIEPVQSGSGDPSPQNQRPISGWTGAEVARTGKNLCPNKIYQRNARNYVIGTDNDNDFPFNLTNGQAYTFSFDATIDTTYSVYVREENETTATQYYGKTITFTPNKTGSYKIVINSALVDTSLSNYSNIQLELGSTTTTYEPYTGNTYTLTWQSTAGTVYGGQLTVFEDGSGEMNITDAGVDMGNLSWTFSNGFFRTGLANVKYVAQSALPKVICEQYKAMTWSAISSSDNGAFAIPASSASPAIFCDTRYSSASDFKTAVSGVKLVYELATQQTYTFPAGTFPSIETLKGTNNIWSNTGDITELTYQKDLVTMLNMLWDAVFNGNNGTRTLASLNLSKGASEEVKKVEETEDEKPVEKEEQR